MNKFLKGAIACAAIVPCLTGFVGCSEKKDKTEEAYNTVFAEVENIASKFSALETVGTEFQLNVNISLDVQQIVSGLPSQDGGISTNLKAAIGARHTETNKEMFANIGIAGEPNDTSVLNAYIIDSIGETEYTKVGKISAEQWNRLKNLLYTEAEGVYIAANTTYDSEAEYYMVTEDLIHVYLNSNISALEEEIEYKITDVIPMLKDGKVYGTLYTGDEIIEDNSTPNDDGDLDDMFEEFLDFDDYNEFKLLLDEAEMKLDRISANGDVGIKISGQGNTIEFVVKSGGGLRLSLNMLMPSGDSGMTSISAVIDIDLSDEFDESYIPTDLDTYGDAMDLDAWIGSLMGGQQ